jgi:hypothetical protein
MAMKPKGVTILVKVYCGLFLVLGIILIGLMSAVVGLTENSVQAFEQTDTRGTPTTQTTQSEDSDQIQELGEASWIPFPIFLDKLPTEAMRTIWIIGGIMLIPLLLFLLLPASKFAWWLGLLALVITLTSGILLIPGVVLILLWCQSSVRKHHKFEIT